MVTVNTATQFSLSSCHEFDLVCTVTCPLYTCRVSVVRCAMDSFLNSPNSETETSVCCRISNLLLFQVWYAFVLCETVSLLHL